jgi:hypothetical protein
VLIRDGRVDLDHDFARDALQIIHDRPREVFVQDRRFQVMRPGARLEGILLFGEKHYSGWSRKLWPGEVITCDGWRPGFDNTAEGVNWTGPRVPENALWVQVWPMQGLFTPWPMDGVLRALPDEN